MFEGAISSSENDVHQISPVEKKEIRPRESFFPEEVRWGVSPLKPKRKREGGELRRN